MPKGEWSQAIWEQRLPSMGGKSFSPRLSSCAARTGFRDIARDCKAVGDVINTRLQRPVSLHSRHGRPLLRQLTDELRLAQKLFCYVMRYLKLADRRTKSWFLPTTKNVSESWKFCSGFLVGLSAWSHKTGTDRSEGTVFGDPVSCRSEDHCLALTKK